jgi:small subunit ribosomal protein S18
MRLGLGWRVQNPGPGERWRCRDRILIRPVIDAFILDRVEENRDMPRKKFGRNRKNRCRFCTRDGCPRPAYVDYKDIGLLKKLCTNQNKVFSRKRSGSCAAFQRAASAAVKRARFMALLPYVGE